ncbi:MAG: hypothetical protein ABIQ93_10030 [Saprospiraceae bacterium]
MEKNMLLTDDLLWDYADGLLEPAERQRVRDALLRQPEAARQLELILAEKKAFASLPLETPKGGFADRVMAAWTLENPQLRPAEKQGRDWMILLISGGFGLLLLFPLLALVVTALRSGAAALPAGYTLPAINWAGVLGNSALHYTIGLTFIFISLRLLDRYLQQAKTLQMA